MKRFVLEHLIEYNEETNVERWERTCLSVDDPFQLSSFLVNNYRIYDTHLNWVYKIKYDENGLPIK
ncbi:hypothetical protein SAMN04487895_101653 [Paenibacillus sophorae]|uniref:Uncharacterized protein n=1 Tax=Paenibacillus sophorae TaxID=1333845 RepID=A0A1H8GVG5_9BACL|nr:hypothetical protein SAMN04487895_101653 [Paenibacillus sophorae]